jgi:hypothetical protein
MVSNDTPPDRPQPQQAGGAQTDRRYARRIDCTERPRPVQPVNPRPAPRDDVHP